MGGPKRKPVRKDLTGVVHDKHKRSVYPACAQYLRGVQGRKLRLRKYIEESEVTTCLWCILGIRRP